MTMTVMTENKLETNQQEEEEEEEVIFSTAFRG
jgi:hypothetical protein